MKRHLFKERQILVLTKQQEAILEYEGNACVLASAGSSKTTTIVLKIIDIKKKNPAAKILYITFTRKAKAHAIEKIGKVDGVTVSNYHGLAYLILMHHKKELQLKNIDIVQEAYAVELLSSLFPDDKADQLQAKLNLVECLKAEETPLKDIEPKDRSVFLRFQTSMLNSKKIMYSDLIYRVNGLFQNNQLNSFASNVLLKFDYIFIDEIQDTNKGQYNFVSNIMGLNPQAKIYGVGDISQSIFRFRFARPDLVLSFISKYNTKIFPLTINFRSQQSIIDLGNKVLDTVEEFKELKYPMNYFKERGDNVKWMYFRNAENQYETICQEISHLVTSGKAKYSDIYIIYRKNFTGAIFERTAIHYHIPFRTLRDSFIRRKEVRYFIALINIVSEYNREEKDSNYINTMVKEISSEIMDDVGAVTYSSLVDQAENGKNIIDVLENINSFTVSGVGAKRKVSIKIFYDRLKILIESHKTYKEDNDLHRYLYSVKKLVQEFKTIKRQKTISFKYSNESIDDLIILIKEVEEPTLEEKINRIIIDYTSEEVSNKDNVVLGLTVHKAKGTENKIVFIPDLQDIPASFSNDEEEEKRVLYVAITRAENKLYLTQVGADTFAYDNIFKNFEYLDTNIQEAKLIEERHKDYIETW